MKQLGKTLAASADAALASIQGLYRQNLAPQKRVATLERTVARLARRGS